MSGLAHREGQPQRVKADADGVLEDDGNAWDTEVEAKDDSAPRIPPGRYDAIVVKGHVHKYRWSDANVSSRFVLTFEVINHPEATGTRLEFVCELPKKVGGKSKFMRAWEVANGARPNGATASSSTSSGVGCSWSRSMTWIVTARRLHFPARIRSFEPSSRESLDPAHHCPCLCRCLCQSQSHCLCHCHYHLPQEHQTARAPT